MGCLESDDLGPARWHYMAGQMRDHLQRMLRDGKSSGEIPGGVLRDAEDFMGSAKRGAYHSLFGLENYSAEDAKRFGYAKRARVRSSELWPLDNKVQEAEQNDIDMLILFGLVECLRKPAAIMSGVKFTKNVWFASRFFAGLAELSE